MLTTPSPVPTGLPLPELSVAPVVQPDMAWAISPLGANGRVSDRECLRAMGWNSGLAIEIIATPGVVVVSSHGYGNGLSQGRTQRLDRSGHLRLVATTRRVAGFAIGERLALIADLRNHVLRILATATLSRIVEDSLGALESAVRGQ